MTQIKQFSKAAQRKGTKKFLLARGVKMDDMKQYLVTFFVTYGHDIAQTEAKTFEELLDKGSMYFTSLKKYTYAKVNRIHKGSV